MVIVDADVHLSPAREGGVGMTVQELLLQMDRAGVDRALAWLQPPYLRQTDEANAYVWQATQAHPERIIGFGWVDPHLGLDAARETIRRCLGEYGFHGVKLNGAQNSFFIDDPALAIPVVEEIALAGTVLALHVGADAFEHTHPFRVGKLAQRYPELPILMVHMGGVGHADLTAAAIEIAQQHRNITLIGSAVKSRPILRAVQVLGAERLCFGSDTPFEYMHVELARYRALLTGEVSDNDLAGILGGNILRVLGLDA
jgi:predicted TIM-barrel fold metal-dependent hydrolase